MYLKYIFMGIKRVVSQHTVSGPLLARFLNVFDHSADVHFYIGIYIKHERVSVFLIYNFKHYLPAENAYTNKTNPDQFFYQKHFDNTLPVDRDNVDVVLDKAGVEGLSALLVIVDSDTVVTDAVVDDFCVELDEAGVDVLVAAVICLLVDDVVELVGDAVVTVVVVEEFIVELDVVDEPFVVLIVDGELVVKGFVDALVNTAVLVDVDGAFEVEGVAEVVDTVIGDETVVDC